MSKTVVLRNMLTGDIFKKIKYDDHYDLRDELNMIILSYDADVLIQYIINNHILNDYEFIDDLTLDKLDGYNYISIIFNDKKTMYCSDNEDGKYILNRTYATNDNYSILLNIIIMYYEYNSYDIIMNSSYKDLVLNAIKVVKNNVIWFRRYKSPLKYVSTKLQNDKEVVLVAVTQTGHDLKYASTDLQNDREIVLVAVIQTGHALRYTNLKLDREIVLEAVKENGNSLMHTSGEFQDDREIILKAVTKTGCSLQYASKKLRNDKEIVLTAVAQDSRSLIYANINLRDDIYCYITLMIITLIISTNFN